MYSIIMEMELYKICTVSGCEKTMRWGKYCSMHRARLLRRGSLGGAEPEQVKHGLHTHPLYHTWENMRARCNNPNHTAYPYYGGRGIKVCERWNNFALFLQDVGDKPSPELTLDRVDVNGDYEPSNVRWATHAQQTHNQNLDKRNKTGTRGVRYDSKFRVYRVAIGRNRKIYHLGSYKKLSDAIKARKDAEERFDV